MLLVDLLEVVEVEEDQREVAAGDARGALDLAQQALVQRGVVEAAGQPVGAGLLGDRGVEAGVAARGGGELGEGLEQREVVLGDVVRARVADGDDAAQLLAPLERDGERGVVALERRAGGQGGDAQVVVREHRLAASGAPCRRARCPARAGSRPSRAARRRWRRRAGPRRACRGRRRRGRRRGSRAPRGRCGSAGSRGRATRAATWRRASRRPGARPGVACSSAARPRPSAAPAAAPNALASSTCGVA